MREIFGYKIKYKVPVALASAWILAGFAWFFFDHIWLATLFIVTALFILFVATARGYRGLITRWRGNKRDPE